ncbi:MAG TPA: type 1 glutamine amidotransferase [Cellulomonas sp.]
MTFETSSVSSTPGPRVVTVVQQDANVPLDMFEEWLDGVELRTIHSYAGEPVPVDPTEVGDGLIVLGGEMSAVDDVVAPWLPATRELLAAASASGVPTLAICLGAQMLALARGGRLQVAAPPGIEAGVIDVQWRPEAVGDALLGGLLDLTVAEERRSTPMPSMHSDAVVDLPRGATWLASSAMYPYQAFRVGSAWGVQFHPEAGTELLSAWADESDDVDTAEVREAYARRADQLTDAGCRIAQAFVALVNESAVTDAALV